ncbi:MAG TPA: hypothetical protein VGC41_15680, partial [Kofleriaceae bacterium]
EHQREDQRGRDSTRNPDEQRYVQEHHDQPPWRFDAGKSIARASLKSLNLRSGRTAWSYRNTAIRITIRE